MADVETPWQLEKFASDCEDTLQMAHADHQLPGIAYERYIDREFFNLEMEHVSRKSWLYAGHASQLPNTGGHEVVDISFAPALIVRGRDRRIRAFLNSCRHRGATLFNHKEGCKPVMMCQYHGWTYDLAGRLIGIPSASCFFGLNKEEYALRELRCEQWGGFIFVNFDRKAGPLHDWLPASIRTEYSDMIAAYPARPRRCAFHREWDISCNWKALVDNSWETYHFQFLHAKPAGAMIDSFRSQMSIFRNGHGRGAFRPQSELKWKGPLEIVTEKLEALPGVSETLASWLDTFNVNVMIFPNHLMNLTRSAITLVRQWPKNAGLTRVFTEMFVEDKGGWSACT